MGKVKVRTILAMINSSDAVYAQLENIYVSFIVFRAGLDQVVDN